MNKIIVSLFAIHFSFFISNAIAQSGFEKVYGGLNTEKFQSAIVTSDGGILTCGDTKSFGLGDPLNTDGYVVKLSSSGDTLWTRNFGSIYNDEANKVMENSQGYLVAGINVPVSPITNDYYLVQYDLIGNKLWEKFYGGAGTDYCFDALINSSNQIILGGGTNSFTFGGSDFYAVKTDENGNFIKDNHYGGTANEIANGIIQTSDGGFAMVGYTNTGTPGYDIYVVKVNSDLDLQWAHNYGGIHDDIGWDIQEDGNQNLWILGYQETEPDSSGIVLIKTDAMGNNAVKYFPGTHEGDYAFSLEKSSSGGFVIAGYTNDLQKGSEMLLIRVDESGDTLWSQHLGSTTNDVAFATTVFPNGNLLIAGETDGFGIANTDAYIAVVDSLGKIPCSQNLSFTVSQNPACIDETIIFTNNTVSSGSFDWKLDGNSFSDQTNSSYYFSAAGEHVVTLSLCNNSVDQALSIDSKPPVHFTYSTTETTVNFVLDPGITVQLINWNFGDGSIENTSDINPVHTYSSFGMYWVILTVTNENGCDSTYIEQINLLTGVNEILQSPFQFFPNPAHDFVNIISSGQLPAIITLYNFLGKEMNSYSIQNFRTQISLAKIPQGIYSIEITEAKGEKYVNKLLIE
ncbi:MAG: T9SS type A sorting domain-containing protein [Chitinophagales bacterium]|nr:T9SS type A sorting domain-containing protein [Chitinophagales bacterium]